MIFRCAKKLNVGQVYTPARITFDSVLMPTQPIHIAREASVEEYLADNPQDELMSELYPGSYYYEVTTD